MYLAQFLSLSSPDNSVLIQTSLRIIKSFQHIIFKQKNLRGYFYRYLLMQILKISEDFDIFPIPIQAIALFTYILPFLVHLY